MSDLIEKVARLAGWGHGHLYSKPVYIDDYGSVLIYNGKLEPTGLRILLDELLRARWTLYCEDGVFSLIRNRGTKDQLVSADTLEEAVMLAYVAHKEGK